MKLQKNTLALVLIALGLGTYTLLTNPPAETPEEAVEPATARLSLLEATAAELASLTITRNDETLSLNQSDAENAWQLAAPQTGSVDPAAIAFLIDILLAKPEGGLQSFEVERALLAEYGLSEPQATLTLELHDGRTQQLLLGNASFEGRALYAALDPDPGDTVEVLLVDPDLQYALARPLEEWLQAETSTPEPREEGEIPATPNPEATGSSEAETASPEE